MKFNITYSLDEIAEIYDGPHATPTKLEEGNAIFLSISSIDNGRLNLDKSSFISEDDFVKWTRRVTPQAGDVVFSYETKIGEASIIPEGLRCCLGRRMGLLRAKQDKVLPQYLLYAYLSPAFQDVIREKTIHGSTTDRISIKEIPSFEIQLPDIHTQRKVIQILSSIDNKLSKNAEINQTLEQIAQALFKSWFIDFEPVKAKIMTLEAGGSQEEATLAAMTAISGKNADSLAIFEQEHPEKYAELRGTAELFPSAMQESELGEIPIGWSCKAISQIVMVKSGYAFKSKDFTNSGFPVIKIKNIIGDGTVDVDDCQYITSETALGLDRFLIKNGDILLAMTGATVGKVGVFVNNGLPAYLNQRVAKFECRKELNCNWFVYNIVSRSDFTSQVLSTAQGSAQPNISAKEIENMLRVFPLNSLIIAYEDCVSKLYQLVMHNRLKNRLLIQLRDTMLPKLLSGEITLPEAEEIAKEVDYV